MVPRKPLEVPAEDKRVLAIRAAEKEYQEALSDANKSLTRAANARRRAMEKAVKDGMNMAEVARALGVSRERVRQLVEPHPPVKPTPKKKPAAKKKPTAAAKAA